MSTSSNCGLLIWFKVVSVIVAGNVVCSPDLWSSGLGAQESKGSIKAELPGAEEVVQDYVDALGGEMQIEGIETYRSTWSMSLVVDDRPVESASQITALMWTLDRGWTLNSKQSRFGFHDGRYWNEIVGQETAWLSDKQAAAMTHIDNRNPNDPVRLLELIRENPEQTTVSDDHQVDGRDVWCLTSNAGTDRHATRFFDKETFLLVKLQYTTEGNQMTQLLGDFQDIDGVLIPHRICFESSINDSDVKFETKLELTKVEINGEVDEKLLALPEKLSGK